MTTPPMPDLPDFCWPIDPGCDPNWNDYDPLVKKRAAAMATATLRRLTLGRVGGCPVTVRPCRQNCAEGFVPFLAGFHPGINASGQWINNGCSCSADCHCGASCAVRLPPPIGRIDQVKVDGVVLGVDQYVVLGNQLVWAGEDECPWPSCQDLTKRDTQVGTFSVTYLNAYPVDGLAAYAAGVLASEFAKACSGSKGCRLPAGVTNVVRQGVTIEISSGSFPDGFTGIREVDAWIATWNPAGLTARPSVYSPDMPKAPVVS